MRNKLFTLLLLCSFAINLAAQRRENIIKLGLVEPYYSTLGIAYERFIPRSEEHTSELQSQ